MRTIIAGSRDITNYIALLDAVENAKNYSKINPTTIISGAARGVDELAIWYAEDNNLPCELFPAEWKVFGKGAGMIRNRKMAENAEALIALWDGSSRGTENMINVAKELKLKVYVQII